MKRPRWGQEGAKKGRRAKRAGETMEGPLKVACTVLYWLPSGCAMWCYAADAMDVVVSVAHLLPIWWQSLHCLSTVLVLC